MPGDIFAHEDGALYMAIADALERDVHSGRLRAGDRLPTHRELARKLGVNVVTVTRGYAEAARRGLIGGEVGRGTFVADAKRSGAPGLGAWSPSAGLVDLGFSLPATDPSRLDVAGQLRALADGRGAELLLAGYTSTGLPEHRAAGAAWIAAAGLDADASRVLVCGGVQHAMTLAFSALAAPGDTILTDAYTYPGMKALAAVLRLRLHGLPMDAHGLLPDALHDACVKGRPRALFCMPTVHNPLGSVMPEARRADVADVAVRHGLPVIEDDTYGYLCADAPRPLAARLPGTGVFLTGLSKCLASGLRIGFLLAPDGGDGATDASTARALSVEQLASHVAAVSWMASPLCAELAARWIADGTAARLAQDKRAEASARRRLFDEVFGADAVTAARVASHVWLPLPDAWSSAAFAAEARLLGVIVTPSEAFRVGRAGSGDAVRLCLGTPPTREDMVRGLGVIRDLARRAPGGGRPVV